MNSFEIEFLKIKEKVLKGDDDIFCAVKREPQRPVILYGAGGNCELAIYTCDSMMIPIAGICDSKAEKGKTYIYKNRKKYNVITLEHLLDEYKDAFVVITPWQYDKEIRITLRDAGFSKERIFSLTSPFRISLEEFENKYLEGYCWAYNFFKDERSKERVLDMLRNRLLGYPCYRDALYTEGYLSFPFPGEQLRDNEVYVDGGCYTGDTAEEFVLKMKENRKTYKAVYSFEPETQVFEMAKSNLCKYRDITLVQKGLWNEETILYLKYNPTDVDLIANYLVSEFDNESCQVPVTSLDTYFSGMSIQDWPSLIKMDIEGSEKEALQGAEIIIKEKKPRLMISAYHKTEDIYELLQTIIDMRSDYEFQLWKLGDGFVDMVLYAY